MIKATTPFSPEPPPPKLTWAHFQPVNEWSTCNNILVLCIIDSSTGDMYWDEYPITIRGKAICLAIGAPIVHVIAAVLSIAVSIFRIIGSLLRIMLIQEGSLEEDLYTIGYCVGKILTAPLVVCALEISAIYAIFSPYNGRKLYASFERLQYGRSVLAPCFQPNPKEHLFGGEPGAPSAW